MKTLFNPLRREPHPIVIGHRGAAGYRLENTLPSFELAIDEANRPGFYDIQ